jgi:hypothetical protein
MAQPNIAPIVLGLNFLVITVGELPDESAFDMNGTESFTNTAIAGLVALGKSHGRKGLRLDKQQNYDILG